MAVSWYGLQFVALRDLQIRPRVRGGNRVLWALGILCVPYLGALLYMSWGSSIAIERPAHQARRARASVQPRVPTERVPEPTTRSRRSTAAPAVTRRQTFPSLHTATREQRSAAPLVHDPVIGTDMSELLQRRSSITPLSSSSDPVIRWPGSSIPVPDPIELRDRPTA
jgi:hypothetical protein